MYRGYIKTWRKILDAGWLKNHKLWAFWSWCLVKATHKEMDQIVGCQSVHLIPGDFIFGRKIASKELAMGEQSIRTLIDFLIKSQNLTIKVTNKFSVISIVNWDIYQGEENETNHQTNQQLTNNQPTTNHKQTHKNEKKSFIIPNIEDVSAYCSERKNKIDPEAWFSYYQSNGWMVGKNKMKDWKASVITWEKRGGNENGTRQGTSGRPAAAFRKEKTIQNDSEQYPLDAEF